MGLLQVEQIREILQDVLSEHAVVVQVNQFRNQLNIVLNKPPAPLPTILPWWISSNPAWDSFTSTILPALKLLAAFKGRLNPIGKR